MGVKMEKFELCGVDFDRMDARKAAARIKKMLRRRGGYCIFTPNFQMLRAAKNDVGARELLRKADMLLPDGVGIGLLCRIHGGRRVQRITGIDMAYFVLGYAAKHGLSVFLLGARE